jgi:hypothetical protein
VPAFSVQVDEDMVAQMAALKNKSQMELDAAVVRARWPTVVSALLCSLPSLRVVWKHSDLELSTVRLLRVYPCAEARGRGRPGSDRGHAFVGGRGQG